MADTGAGFTEPGSPNRQFATDRRNEAGTDRDWQKVIEQWPGTWGYRPGTSGTVNDLPAGSLVLSIDVVASATVDATITIAGGGTITVPAGMAFGLLIRGKLVAPTIVFTNTASFVIQYTS